MQKIGIKIESIIFFNSFLKEQSSQEFTDQFAAAHAVGMPNVNTENPKIPFIAKKEPTNKILVPAVKKDPMSGNNNEAKEK